MQVELVEICGYSRTRQFWCDFLDIQTCTITRRVQRKGMSVKDAILWKTSEEVVMEKISENPLAMTVSMRISAKSVQNLLDKFDSLMSHLNSEENEMAAEFRQMLQNQ